MAVTLTSRFDAAVAYASAVHAAQRRKGTEVPYFAHPLGVASLVLEDGGSEDEAIGALLHDAAEDHGGRERLADIRARFGDAVADIVEGCTDSWEPTKEPWVERKAKYVEHARALPPATLRVSAADKVHNAYGILRDLRNHGESAWSRLNASPDDVVAYYVSIARAFRESGGGPLVAELDRIIKGIQREIGY